ncbi:histidine phosphatase superfamily [Mycena leptocephala]|nr:histidine phosphatase superfamily [Mycena leptocephala]
MFVYAAAPGFFAQDDPLADADVIGPVLPRFGLLDASDTRWANLSAKLHELNAGDDAVSYKLFFFGRHGEGYHNVGREKYGNTNWLAHWSKLNRDEEISWGPDAGLTAIGKDEAANANRVWKEERAMSDVLSPMTRAMQTNAITFEGVSEQRAVVVENVREWNGAQTCDKRKTRAYIKEAFPQFDIESGFTDEDELWEIEAQETQQHAVTRAKTVLDRIFIEDTDVTFVSITAHVGIISSFMRAIGRDWYRLPTGGVLPVIVKGSNHGLDFKSMKGPDSTACHYS